MAEKIGISPWEIRYRNAIRPGGVLPNGQIVGAETGLVETLEAVKPAFDEAVKAGKPVGLACAMKNAGVGVGSTRLWPVQAHRRGGRKASYLRGRVVHWAGTRHGSRANVRNVYAAFA